MENRINWNQLTPACYAVANRNGVDLGVAESMILQNLREGREANPGAEDLPAGFRPDWAALGRLEVDNRAYNAWRRTRQANMKSLAALWNAQDYAGLAALLEGAADPWAGREDQPEAGE